MKDRENDLPRRHRLPEKGRRAQKVKNLIKRIDVRKVDAHHVDEIDGVCCFPKTTMRRCV